MLGALNSSIRFPDNSNLSIASTPWLPLPPRPPSLQDTVSPPRLMNISYLGPYSPPDTNTRVIPRLLCGQPLPAPLAFTSLVFLLLDTMPADVAARKKRTTADPTPAPEGDHRKRRRNRTTQSCLNCHASKRMVCLFSPYDTFILTALSV